MDISTHHPKDPILSKYIAYFYFLNSSSNCSESNYYAFPNVNNGLSIYKNANYSLSDNKLCINSIDSNSPLTLIQSRYQNPLEVELRGKLNAITIVFKPLGINHFISKPFAVIAKNQSQKFVEWESTEFDLFIRNFFIETDLKSRADILEVFLKTRLTSFNNCLMLQKVIAMLSDLDNKKSIEFIASDIGLSTRTLNRLFRENLGVSPSAYRRVLQFRLSLKNKLLQTNTKSLTQIVYEGNYFDPSYFNKTYKQLTNLNPTAFFKSVRIPNDEGPLFQYKNKVG